MLWQRNEGWGVKPCCPGGLFHPSGSAACMLEVGSAPLPALVAQEPTCVCLHGPGCIWGQGFWCDAHAGDKLSLIFTSPPSPCALFQAAKVKCAITLSACSAQKLNRDVPGELTLISVCLPSKAISPCSYGSQKLSRWR